MNTLELLKKWMDFRGKDYTQKQLSLDSGLTETTISTLINGKRRPEPESFDKICMTWDITLEQFWAGPNKSESEDSDDLPVISGTIEREFVISNDEREMRRRLMDLICFELDPKDLERVLGYLEGLAGEHEGKKRDRIFRLISFR